jgi:translation initiation factor 1 (eIF-1/SUI1)
MKKFIDPDPSPGKLAHNPFAGLAGAVPEDLPQHLTAPENAAPAAITRPWVVGKTRKGGFAISIERRAKGKQVTVLRNVSGDAEALLRALKKRCGAGGVVREGAIELQGDHQAAVLEFVKHLPNR